MTVSLFLLSVENRSEIADYVFDFELEDRSTAIPANKSDVQDPNPEVTRNRNIVEETLSTTYASHAPSHRSGHQKRQTRSDLYGPLRRRNTDDSDSITDIDENAVSKLATSVPVHIALPGPSKATVYPFERKTSLSDREGILVPPLIKAMRQRGILPEGNSLGLTSPGASSLSGGTRMGGKGKDRDLAHSFKADPGAVFESMADEVGDGDDDESGEKVGTLKGKKFVPPHVLARKESLQSKDVGWRSMATD